MIVKHVEKTQRWWEAQKKGQVYNEVSSSHSWRMPHWLSPNHCWRHQRNQMKLLFFSPCNVFRNRLQLCDISLLVVPQRKASKWRRDGLPVWHCRFILPTNAAMWLIAAPLHWHDVLYRSRCITSYTNWKLPIAIIFNTKCSLVQLGIFQLVYWSCVSCFTYCNSYEIKEDIVRRRTGMCFLEFEVGGTAHGCHILQPNLFCEH